MENSCKSSATLTMFGVGSTGSIFNCRLSEPWGYSKIMLQDATLVVIIPAPNPHLRIRFSSQEIMSHPLDGISTFVPRLPNISREKVRHILEEAKCPNKICDEEPNYSTHLCEMNFTLHEWTIGIVMRSICLIIGKTASRRPTVYTQIQNLFRSSCPHL